MGTGKKGKNPAPTIPSATEKRVAKWVAQAPTMRGLRRPGTRLKAAALLQQMDADGFTTKSQKTDMDLDEMAAFVGDIDELLATLGGDAYVEWIERVPLTDGLQVAVLLELFMTKVFPDLGKG